MCPRLRATGRRQPSGSGSYTRTCICVFVQTGPTGRREALLLAVGSNRGGSHPRASVGRCSRVGFPRESGTSRDSLPVRSGVLEPRDFGRAAGGCELVDSRRRADRIRLINSAPLENAVFGRRFRPRARSSDGARGGLAERISQASVTHERVSRTARRVASPDRLREQTVQRRRTTGESLHRIGCESRRSNEVARQR